MARFHFTRSIRSMSGTVRQGSEVAVYVPGTTDPTPVTLYGDPLGGGTLAPVFIAENGIVDFYVEEGFLADFAVTPSGGATVTIPNVWVGVTLRSGAPADHTHTAIEVGAIPAGDITEVEAMTQAEYAALPIKSATTLYVIRPEA